MDVDFTDEKNSTPARRLLKKKVTLEADDVKNEHFVALKLIFFAISSLLLKLSELISDFMKHSDEVHKEDDGK